MISPAAVPPAAPSVAPVGLEPALEESHPRLKVQARASQNIRRHFVRATRRVAVLGALDVALLWAASELLQALRAASWAPAAVAGFFPYGFFGGPGAHLAIIVGLVFVGAYGTQERWANPGLVLKGVALGAGIALWQSIDVRGLSWTLLHWIAVVAAVGTALVVARLLLHRWVLRYRARTSASRSKRANSRRVSS